MGLSGGIDEMVCGTDLLYRVTGNDGYSRKEFYALSEQMALQRAFSSGYVPVQVELISGQEIPKEEEFLDELERVLEYVPLNELYNGYSGSCPTR